MDQLADDRIREDRDPGFAAPPLVASSPPRPRRRRWLWPSLLALAMFVAGAVGVAYAIHRWDEVAELVRPAQPQAAAAIVPPAPQPVAAPAVQVPDAELTGRVDTLEQKIAAIDARASEASGDADRAEGLLVAFAARRALDRGQPAGFLEPMLRRHFGATEPRAVATVLGASLRPVTLVQLEQRFADLAPALQQPAATENWWTALRREFGQMIVVRKANEAPAMPVNRLARAERALGQGQVDIALDEVARLPGAPAAADWMASARRYVLARNALDRIETAALLAPDPATTPPPAPQN